MRLNQFNEGDTIKLISFGQVDFDYRRKLLALGVTYNTSFKVMKRAPLGCPIQIKVRGVLISLRVNEAKDLEWQKA